jgi:hypothetical protein
MFAKTFLTPRGQVLVYMHTKDGKPQITQATTLRGGVYVELTFNYGDPEDRRALLQREQAFTAFDHAWANNFVRNAEQSVADGMYAPQAPISVVPVASKLYERYGNGDSLEVGDHGI